MMQKDGVSAKVLPRKQRHESVLLIDVSSSDPKPLISRSSPRFLFLSALRLLRPTTRAVIRSRHVCSTFEVSAEPESGRGECR